MINREAERFYRDLGKQNSIDAYRIQVTEGFNPNGADFLRVPKEVSEKLVDDVVKIELNTCSQLGIVLPRMGLTHDWNQPLPGFEKDPSVRDVVANATVNANTPEGVISISPFYLKSELNFRMGIDQPPVLPLGYLLAHETFHLWQYNHTFDRVLRDLAVYEHEGLDAWSQTETELLANEYANDWFLKHAQPTYKKIY